MANPQSFTEYADDATEMSDMLWLFQGSQVVAMSAYFLPRMPEEISGIQASRWWGRMPFCKTGMSKSQQEASLPFNAISLLTVSWTHAFDRHFEQYSRHAKCVSKQPAVTRRRLFSVQQCTAWIVAKNCAHYAASRINSCRVAAITVVPMNADLPMAAQSTGNFCEQHRNRVIKYYCNDCKHMMCGECHKEGLGPLAKHNKCDKCCKKRHASHSVDSVAKLPNFQDLHSACDWRRGWVGRNTKTRIRWFGARQTGNSA